MIPVKKISHELRVRPRRQGKEAAGTLTGDDSTKNEGKLDQAKASLKDAGEKVKGAFKN